MPSAWPRKLADLPEKIGENYGNYLSYLLIAKRYTNRDWNTDVVWILPERHLVTDECFDTIICGLLKGPVWNSPELFKANT